MVALGKAGQQLDLLDPVSRFCDEALSANSIYGFLHQHREALFPDAPARTCTGRRRLQPAGHRGQPRPAGHARPGPHRRPRLGAQPQLNPPSPASTPGPQCNAASEITKSHKTGSPRHDDHANRTPGQAPFHTRFLAASRVRSRWCVYDRAVNAAWAVSSAANARQVRRNVDGAKTVRRVGCTGTRRTATRSGSPDARRTTRAPRPAFPALAGTGYSTTGVVSTPTEGSVR